MEKRQAMQLLHLSMVLVALISTTTVYADDYGDAPASYGDASAIVDSDIRLGWSGTPDNESTSSYNYQAYGDFNNNQEENGAPQSQWGINLFPVLIETDSSYTTPIIAKNQTGGMATLEGWIDFDHNGTFDADEKTTLAVPTGTSGAVSLNWPSLPSDISRGTTFIRLRLTNDSTGAGEVEDHVIGIAKPFPQEDSRVGVYIGDAVKACQAVIFEDDFDDLTDNTYIGPNRPGSVAIRDWTTTGGGNDTYARARIPPGHSDIAIYLGNGQIRRISPSMATLGGLSFDANGRLTSIIDAFELRSGPDDLTTTPAPLQTDSKNSLSSWGPDEVVFSRSFPSVAGKTYRLYFNAIPESGPYLDGMMRIDTPVGSAHFLAPASGTAEISYAIEFTAISSSTKIAIGNYGHIGKSSDGWCSPQEEAWCTQDGMTSGATNEVIVDDIYVVEAACDPDYSDAPVDGSSAPSGVGTTSYGSAVHGVISGVQLGATITIDTNAAFNADNASDDGISSFPALAPGDTSYTIPAANISATGSGTLHAWIDVDGNGAFDADEYTSASVSSGTLSGSLAWSFSDLIAAGTTYARFRFTSDTLSSTDAATSADDGEVEDYAVTITSSPTTQATGGLTIVPNAPILSCPNNLIINGDFEVEAAGTLWGVAQAGGSGAITGWVASDGGGEDTYAAINSGAGGITNLSAYFGNGGVRSVSPALTSGFAFTADGEATNVPGFIEIRGPADDVAGINGSSPGVVTKCCDQGGLPISLSQTVATTSGNTYHLRFSVKGEGGNGHHGVVKLAIAGNFAHFQVPANAGTRSYTVQFTATAATTTIDFINYGHFYQDNGGYCDPTEKGQCTNNGLGNSGQTSELTLDDVELAETVCAAGATLTLEKTVTNNDGGTAADTDWTLQATDNTTTISGTEGDAAITAGTLAAGTYTLSESGPLGYTQTALTCTGAADTDPTDGLMLAAGEVVTCTFTNDDVAAPLSSTIRGRVYIDANSSSTEEVGEAGIGGTVVVLYDSFSNTCRSVTTNGNGDYSFAGVPDGGYEIYQAHGETTTLPQSCGSASAKNPAGYQSTTADLLSIMVVGADITDQDFGEVAGANSSTTGNTGSGIRFDPDHQSEVLPGNVVFYAHTFSAEADGTVSFTATGGGHITSGWTHTLHYDDNCNGELDGTEGLMAISGIDFAITAGSKQCIIDKVYAPANAPQQDQYVVETTATFTFAGGAPAPIELKVKDITTTGQQLMPTTSTSPQGGASRLVLRKTVENTSQMTPEMASSNQAEPGDVLKYRIYYRNTGAGPITDLEVNDTVPPYTAFVMGSESCDTTPAGLSCTANRNLGVLVWDFIGSLPGGAEGSVSFEVMLNN